MTTTVFAQKSVTKFLGIAIDGSKTEMVKKLKSKGYSYNSIKDCLDGEFNGMDVEISVVTNNNKVYRIFIMEKYSHDESQIKIRYTNLCQQFMNNSKYISLTDYTILMKCWLTIKVTKPRFFKSMLTLIQMKKSLIGLFGLLLVNNMGCIGF